MLRVGMEGNGTHATRVGRRAVRREDNERAETRFGDGPRRDALE